MGLLHTPFWCFLGCQDKAAKSIFGCYEWENTAELRPVEVQFYGLRNETLGESLQFPREQGIRPVRAELRRDVLVPWDLGGRPELEKQSVHRTSSDGSPATCGVQYLVLWDPKAIWPGLFLQETKANHMRIHLKIQIVLYVICQNTQYHVLLIFWEKYKC